MKKSEIVIGGVYVGKNGRQRRVVGKGGVAYAGQIDTDTVRYVDLRAKGTAQEKDMTRASFASWAQSRAS